MNKTITATVDRRHVFGTNRYALYLMYRGSVVVRRTTGGGRTYETEPCDGDPSFQRIREAAKRQGFTHIRVTGDWEKRTKPKGGKL